MISKDKKEIQKWKTHRQFNPDLGTIAWSAFFIEKVHRCADCPIRQIGDQTAAVDLRPAPRLAQDLVAGLESPPGEDVRLRRQGKALKPK